MKSIIPYDENMIKNGGAFISPNGKIIFVHGKHEEVAYKLCNGSYYDFLSDVKNNSSSYYYQHFDEFKRKYNFKGNRENIDEYSSTKLTKAQLELYKLWIKEYEFSDRELLSDFMIYFLYYDKIVTLKKNIIVTTSNLPHMKYYNYFLMDYDLDQRPLMEYNNETKTFDFKDNSNSLFLTHTDEEYENEINHIKKMILKKDRYLFFK